MFTAPSYLRGGFFPGEAMEAKEQYIKLIERAEGLIMLSYKLIRLSRFLKVGSVVFSTAALISAIILENPYTAFPIALLSILLMLCCGLLAVVIEKKHNQAFNMHLKALQILLSKKTNQNTL